MAEDKKVMDAGQAEEQQAERAHVVKLDRPVKFEQKEYTEIDLGGLDGMTIQDAINAQRSLLDQSEAACSLLCETTTAFAMEIAARASGLPIEFFKTLPRNAGKRVQAEVLRHISKNRQNAGKVMQLEKPYYFKGEQYTEFDLSGIADMSVMQESAAENVLAREGFIIAETSFNFLYACVLASMAVNQPKELFTGLPLCDLLNLKESVKATDFFE